MSDKYVIKCGGKWVDKELAEAVESLCERIVKAHNKAHPALTGELTVYPETGRKYIKIVREDNQRSVWGFINIKDFYNKKAVPFKEGDVLMASSWSTPALNKPRGNLLKSEYAIVGMRQYGPDYL